MLISMYSSRLLRRCTVQYETIQYVYNTYSLSEDAFDLGHFLFSSSLGYRHEWI